VVPVSVPVCVNVVVLVVVPVEVPVCVPVAVLVLVPELVAVLVPSSAPRTTTSGAQAAAPSQSAPPSKATQRIALIPKDYHAPRGPVA
jgi:hypothetical protein